MQMAKVTKIGGTSAAEQATARRLLALLEAFRAHDKEMPAQTMAVFALVAQNDGEITQRVLEDKLGIAQSAVSRNVIRLSEGEPRVGKAGLELIRAEIDIMDRRNRVLRLTPKGRQLWQTVSGIIG
jgi:DNA-binding MarR family transcriptional regulator